MKRFDYIAGSILIIVLVVSVFEYHHLSKNIKVQDEKIASLTTTVEAQQKSMESLDLLVSDIFNELLVTTRIEPTVKERIEGFLVDRYGPCWGIPEGQCRE